MDTQELKDTWDLVCDTFVLGELDYWADAVVYRKEGRIEISQIDEDSTRFGTPWTFLRSDLARHIKGLKHRAVEGELRADLAQAILQDDFDDEAVDVMVQLAMLGEITYS